jgi:hypothetical protein
MEIPSFLTDYANYLKDLSYDNSEERKQFAESKLLAHKFYMQGFRKTTPYLHPDTWQEDNEGQLPNMEKASKT